MNREEEKRFRELEDLNACMSEIIRNVSEGVILTDSDCKIVLFNPAKEKMEQMKADEVVGEISWEAYSRSSREISEHQRVSDTHTPILNAYRPHAYVGDAPVYIYYSTYPILRDGRLLGAYTISRNETLLRELLYETIEHKRQLYMSRSEHPDKKHIAKGTQFTFSDFVGSSPAIQQVLRDAQTVAALSASILITGETGTGKEVLAQSIHNFGREDKKFIAINCAAIPESLLESTLFGSVKGAYTGATDSPGLFREAENGTLFLDEINSMNIIMQAKLLRVLQEKSVRPVGSAREYPVMCRLICASNEDPELLLREKRLRQDLYYRISDFILFIPPLRQRREDVLDLACQFIRQYNREFSKNVQSMSAGLRGHLVKNQWPGNTRQLQHAVQNMMLRVSETTVELDDKDYLSYSSASGDKEKAGEGMDYLNTDDLSETLRELQREIIETRLKHCGGNLSQTADSLGLHRQNLAARLKRLIRPTGYNQKL